MSFDWDASVYDEVEREAAADARYFGADEDDNRPDPSEWYSDDPTACPTCGGAIEVDPEDRSVGIFGDVLYCADEECGWTLKV